MSRRGLGTLTGAGRPMSFDSILTAAHKVAGLTTLSEIGLNYEFWHARSLKSLKEIANAIEIAGHGFTRAHTG